MSGTPDPKPNRRFGPKPERRRFDFGETKRRYLAGEDSNSLARELGVSSTAIRGALRRMGVEIRTDSWKHNLQLSNTRQKTSGTCKQGLHEYTPETTYIKRSLGGVMVRECRKCRNLSVAKRRTSQKARGIKRLHGWHLSRKGELPICRNCGSNDRVQLHHAIPRSKCTATRADLRNGIPLCHTCHYGWHSSKVTIYRDVFRPDEWEYIAAAPLTGESIEAWLDKRYPVRQEQAA